MKICHIAGVFANWGTIYNEPTFTGSTKINVINNSLRNTVNDMNDGAPLYINSEFLAPDGIVLKGNYINTNESSNGFYGGIYIDTGSSNVDIEDNVVIDCQRWIFEAEYGLKSLTIKNNFTNTPANETDAHIKNHATDIPSSLYSNNQVITNWQSNSDIQRIINNAKPNGTIGTYNRNIN